MLLCLCFQVSDRGGASLNLSALVLHILGGNLELEMGEYTHKFLAVTKYKIL